jgi:hypothetical protein
MSDLFKRLHELTPRQFRQQHPQARRESAVHAAGRYLAAGRRGALYARLNEPEKTAGISRRGRSIRSRPARLICVIAAPGRRAITPYPDRWSPCASWTIYYVRMSAANWSGCTYPAGVCHRYQRPFLSSRLFATGWDDPQMAGYACWYHLQQIFSWLAAWAGG